MIINLKERLQLLFSVLKAKHIILFYYDKNDNGLMFKLGDVGHITHMENHILDRKQK